MTHIDRNRRDVRWDGWPVAEAGVATPWLGVIDPTDPDWVVQPTPWDGIDSVRRTAAPIKTLAATVSSLDAWLKRATRSRTTPG